MPLTLLSVLLVAAGGAVGSVARYLAGVAVSRLTLHVLPYATFSVNILGSLLIGLLAGWILRHPDSDTQQNLKMLLMTGFCGGFTTFSSFSLEVFNLLRAGQGEIAIGYILLSVLLCVAMCWAGFSLSSGGN